MSARDTDDIRHWLALLRAPGVGPAAATALLERFGSLSGLFEHGPADQVLEAPLREYLRAPDWVAVEADLAWLQGPDRHLLTWDDPRFPPLLKDVSGLPLVLFVHGSLEALGSPQLAMVGSRNPTADGQETAFDFARHLAGAGLAITSGLALGIDAASHRGALAAPGQTVAVAGTGLDRVYPARHRDLAHAIVDGGGALVSEFTPGTGPLPAHFPRRNRIISGLSLGTLVVEAALRSGSLITARLAGEQGREVFAIPGSIHSPLARGCHRLLREGAKLVEGAGDILEELAPHLYNALAEPQSPGEAAPSEALDPDYRCLLESLGYEPTSVDTLVERTRLTAEAVSSMLLILEMQGHVTSAPGSRYMRTSKRA